MTSIIIPQPIAGEGYLLYECTQGSPEWLAMRAGVVTASEFHKARARLKRASGDKKVGHPTDVCEDYAFQKAIERISRVPLDESHTTWQMKRGHDLEPFARMAHEKRLASGKWGRSLQDMLVMPAGFMTTPDGKYGCSVDGLVGEHGGAEYKCLVSAKRLRKVILSGDISEFMDQVQGCLWVSGRRWWHFGLYCPALKPVGLEFQMVEVQRDDDYIDDLARDLLVFDRIVTEQEEQLRALGAAAVAEAVAEARAALELVAGEEPVFAED